MNDFLERMVEKKREAEAEAFRQTIGGRIADLVRLLGTDYIGGFNMNVEAAAEGEDGEQVWYPPGKIMEVARLEVGDDVEKYYISEGLEWIVVHETIDKTTIREADAIPAFVLKKLFKLHIG